MELIKGIKLSKPRNCEVGWTFNVIASHKTSWSRLDWKRLSDCPAVTSLLGEIDDIENKHPCCVICGGSSGGFGMHNHHLIPNFGSVHPTGMRILDHLTIGVCSGCHGANGGTLHNRDEYELELYNKYSKLVEEKMEKVGELIDEVDKMALEYEVDCVKYKFEVIKKQRKYCKKMFKKSKNGNR